MKTILVIILIAFWSSLSAHADSYKINKGDTINLSDLKFKRVVALQFNEAIVLVDYNTFISKLEAERRGLKKQISQRERMLKRGTDFPDITSSQLRMYQRQFPAIDSIFKFLKSTKKDTLWVNNNVFVKANTPFGDFLPSVLEAKQCMVLDLNKQLQKYIIKQSSSQRTGQMTAVGSSYYFIPGAKRHFLSKMDWVS